MPENTDTNETDVIEDNASLLETSDEDFLKMEEPSEETPDDTVEDEDVTTEEEEDTESDDDDEETLEEDEEEASEEDEETDEDGGTDETEDDNEVDETVEETDSVDEEEEPETTEEEEESSETKDSSDINYKAEYEKLLAPFKANGTDISVKNVDDAITLMQMGANYHKKMAALKPSLKTLKLLDNNDLLDPEKLNYLIDLHNKNPEAITKLIKDSELDPLDLNVKDDSTYEPTSRTVSDTEVELDEVLDSIKSTPTYSTTLNVITKQWDDTSRNIIANTPQIIALLNSQIENGIYDKINSVVTYERSLGRLVGVSDLDAYRQVGDQLHSEGKLKLQTQSEEKEIIKPKPKPKLDKQEQDRKKRKKAAGSTRKVGGNSSPAPFDPLAMSDEEFEKFDESKLAIK